MKLDKKMIMLGAVSIPAAIVGGVMAEAQADPEKLLAEVSQKLDSLTSQVKQTAEDALREAKQAGEVSAQTKRAADEQLSQHSELAKSVKALTDKLEGTDARFAEIEQSVVSGGRRSGGAVQSLGAMLAGGDDVAAYLNNGAAGTRSIDVSAAILTANTGHMIEPDYDPNVARKPRRRILVRNLLTQGTTGSNSVHYTKQTVQTNAAAMIAEGIALPESAYEYAGAETNVRKIGHHINVSEETLADAGQLQTEIDGELRYGLDKNEEAEILAGDGTGQHFSGLITEASAFVAASGLPNATRIDRLRLAILQLVLSDGQATAMLLSPTDWAAIELQKVSGTDDRYVFGNPNTQATPLLWGRDVVDTNAMTAGEWLVGDLAEAATYYDRQSAEVLLSTEHDKNFIEGMVTMKAVKRAALAVRKAHLLVTGDFTFA